MASDYAIAVRFGDDLLDSGFTAIPNLVLDHYHKLGITTAEMMFVIHIWKFWWLERNPHPSLNSIAETMGITKRQAIRYSASLQEKGFLAVTERHDPDRGQLTNEYDFTTLIQAVRGVSKMSLGGVSSMSVPSDEHVTRIRRTH
jgi:DNA replication protein